MRNHNSLHERLEDTPTQRADTRETQDLLRLLDVLLILSLVDPQLVTLLLRPRVLLLAPFGVSQSIDRLDERVARGIIELDRERRHLPLIPLSRFPSLDQELELVQQLLNLLPHLGLHKLTLRLVALEVSNRIANDALHRRELSTRRWDLQCVFGQRDEAVLGLDELAVEVEGRSDLDGVETSEGSNLDGALDRVVAVACTQLSAVNRCG